MRLSIPHLSITILSVILLACSGESTEGAERSPLGKTDRASGSCVGFCGGPSDGACWCDDLCESVGDCCDDKPVVCDGLCAAEGESCIEVPCCNGVTCNGETSTCFDDGPSCAGEGELCIEVPCCFGTCDGESSRCVVDACPPIGESCLESPCCGSATCDPDTATCL